MPDANEKPIPGEEGYVAPVETEAAALEQPQGEETTILGSQESPLDELKAVEAQLKEQEAEKPTYVSTEAVPIVSQEKYNQLLSAYTKLKQRVGLDIVYEKQLDSEAGL